MVGKKTDTHLGNNYRYIETYAQKANLSPLAACLKVMTDVEKVLQEIFGMDRQADLILKHDHVWPHQEGSQYP